MSQYLSVSLIQKLEEPDRDYLIHRHSVEIVISRIDRNIRRIRGEPSSVRYQRKMIAATFRVRHH